MTLDTGVAVSRLRGLTAIFDSAVKAPKLFYPMLSSIVPSDGADEEYGMLGAIASVREWLGDRNWKTERAAKWTIENKLWELSHLIDRADLDDDRMGMHRLKMADMGRRAAKHPDKLLYALINAGESDSLGTSFDGQYFFDTDHEWGTSGSQSNDLSYVAATGTVPTIAEFKAAYNAATAALMTFKDDQGELLNDEIFDANQQVVVVVPLALQQIAHDALSVRTVAAGGENFVITLPKIIATAGFTAGDEKFDVYKVDEPLMPYIFQAREALRRQMKNLTDIEEKAAKFMTEARYNMGYGAWWTAVRTTFT